VVRNKSLLIFISFLLLGALTLVDTRSYYLEQEELIESRPTEIEELEERAEGKDVFRFLPSSGHGALIVQSPFELGLKNYSCFKRQGNRVDLFTRVQIDLFLKYCSLKIPFC